jgi:hypothetical protein
MLRHRNELPVCDTDSSVKDTIQYRTGYVIRLNRLTLVMIFR